jgi:arylsulfatase A-like enzyme/lipopolysaccharide biosynthesis regulator YciM
VSEDRSKSRRRLAGGLALLLLLGAGAWLLLREPAVRPAAEAWSRLARRAGLDRHDVVLITIDTLRADRLGSYGSPRATTPHLDALAVEGVRFTNAATTVPFTLPAHSSMMTGTYPPFHGVRENVGYELGDRLPTLASSLADGGWATGGFVSAFVLDSRWGIGRGFETFFDDFDPAQSASGNLASVQRDGAETVAAALDWLDRRSPGPFFLWLHLFEPHDPYEPPEPYRSRNAGRPYDGEVAYADALVGRFREALEERGLFDRALVIVTGDHGEGLGQHGEGFHGFFVYDSTVRVPLIVRPPFRELAGGVVDAAVSHVDLLPTILEATGRPIPEHAQGRSLLPLILGRDEPAEGERLVYSESMYPLVHYGWAPLRSLRSRGHKLIDAPLPELYELEADPAEETNLVLRRRQLHGELASELEAMLARIDAGDAVPAGRAELDEETLGQLEALGYLAGRGGVAIEEEDARERADPKDRIELHQLVMSAQSVLGKGDLDAARRHLEEALAKDASMVDAHQMLGTIGMRQERFPEALESFKAALAVKEDHLASLFGLANAYRRMGRNEEALVGFRRLLGLDPEDVKAVMAVADLLVADKREPEAVAVLEGALARENPPPLLLNQLGELRALAGHGEAAAELFVRALEAKPELVVARFNLAVLHEEAGRLDEAITYYEETVERAPGHFQAQFNLGRLYGRRGEPRRQVELWEAAIASNPEFARGYFYLGKLLMDRGEDLTRAEALVRQGLAKDPGHRTGPLGYYVLADILNRTGRGREAARAVETGQRLEGEGSG